MSIQTYVNQGENRLSQRLFGKSSLDMSSMHQIKAAPSSATTLEVAFPKKQSHNGFSQQPRESADIFSQTNTNDKKTWLHYTALV